MLREVHEATMNAMIDLINLTTVRKEKGQMLFTEGKKNVRFRLSGVSRCHGARVLVKAR